MHYEMEQEEHDVYPDDPDFDINKARLVTTDPRICVRYECVPIVLSGFTLICFFCFSLLPLFLRQCRLRGLLLFGCVRYECVPMRFIKHVYKIHTYAQDGRLFEEKTIVFL